MHGRDIKTFIIGAGSSLSLVLLVVITVMLIMAWWAGRTATWQVLAVPVGVLAACIAIIKALCGLVDCFISWKQPK